MVWSCSLVSLAATVVINGHFSHVSAAPYSVWKRQQTPFDVANDPFDQSWVKQWAAIGDSYSAGIGAGSPLKYGNLADRQCSRYDNSYPSLMNDDERMGSEGQNFQYLSCSGATSPQVLKNQVPTLGSNLDLITLSSGGNDVGLVNILDACIFQFKLGDDARCEKQLQDTSDLIANTLPGNLDQLLQALQPKLASGAKIYHTGYAKFFNAETTACDTVSWAFPYAKLFAKQKQFLTQTRRQKMNDLVDATNKAIQDAATRAGGAVVFVDYDQYYSMTEGRYCEESVNEPDPDRNGLLFFEFNTRNVITLSKRDDEPPEEVINDPDTFEGEIEAMIKDTLAANPDSSVGASRLQVSDGSDPSTNETSISGNVAVNAAILLDTGDEGKIPDDWTRVFHPNPAGHAVIANLIFWKMSVERAKVLNTQMGPELVPAPETCAFNEGDPTKTPTCSANNVPSVPSQVVDSASNKLDMNAVMFIMRQVICSNQCQAPANVPDNVLALYPSQGSDGECEISIALQGNIEAYMYRGTAAKDEQWQQCWDATENIINKCIANGPNTGWVNGPAVYQFYQAGFRQLNGDGSKHTKKLTGGDDVLKTPAMPFTSDFVQPSKFDGTTIDCADRTDGAGADTTGTFWTAGSAIVMGERLDANTQLCTTDISKCISHGVTTDGKGTNLSNWCLVYQQGNTGFVIADKYPDFAAPGSSCINGAQMSTLGVWAANNCAGNSKTVVVAGRGAKGDGEGVSNTGQWQQTLCIVNTDHPEVCIS